MLGLMQRHRCCSLPSSPMPPATTRGRWSRSWPDGSLHRTAYAEVERRSRRLARAMQQLGVGWGTGSRTLAWNGHRHLELYYAISGMGAVCHTVNPRLAPETSSSS